MKEKGRRHLDVPLWIRTDKDHLKMDPLLLLLENVNLGKNIGDCDKRVVQQFEEDRHRLLSESFSLQQ